MTPAEIGSQEFTPPGAPLGGEESRLPGEGDGCESVLCVDDDPHILAALRRQFRNKFTIETAIGPDQGLAAIAGKGPFAVVISDLRMPGMSGIQFLAAVRAQSPDTVRVMLTGQADMADAIAAVNQGAIFRFLLKPSSATILGKVIESALEQRRLIVAERQLTQQTLVGCVEVLAEVLSIVEPVAFSRTSQVLRFVRRMSGVLKLTDSWQVEAATMLSQIGWITIPAEIVSKLTANQPLSPEESQRFHEHPAAAARMIERIPRLRTVAQIVEAQFAPYEMAEPGRDPVRFGAAILQAAIDFDELRRQGMSPEAALAELRGQADRYHPDVLEAIGTIEKEDLDQRRQELPLEGLKPGMILDQDICLRSGLCVVGSGHQLTATSIERLAGFQHAIDTGLPFSVRIPETKPPAIVATDGPAPGTTDSEPTVGGLPP